MEKSYDMLIEENESLCSYMIDIAKKLKSANQMYQELISQIDIMKQEHSFLVESLKIKELTEKNQKLTKELEDVNITNGELVMENEELKEKINELTKPKTKAKKEPELWEGNLQEYNELGKDLITKKELMEWIKNPDEVKTLTLTKSKTHNPSGNPEKASKEGTCNAMANWGKTKCYRPGFGEWCYCKQHIDMFKRGAIHGDAREGKDWEMEEKWKEMVKENKIKTKEDKKSLR